MYNACRAIFLSRTYLLGEYWPGPGMVWLRLEEVIAGIIVICTCGFGGEGKCWRRLKILMHWLFNK